MISTSPIILKFGEENELGFMVFVDGTTSDATLRTTVRFVLEEENGPCSWCFPTRKAKEKGKYVAHIPDKPWFRPNKTYRGYVEVLLRDYYFVPVETPVRFFSEKSSELGIVAERRPRPFLEKHINVSVPIVRAVGESVGVLKPRVSAVLVETRRQKKATAAPQLDKATVQS